MTPTKRCRLCGGEFPATPEHFYVRASSRDGFRNECKACLKKLNKARYAANPEKYIAKQRQYWKTHREARREYQRQWRARNPEKLREKNRRYYARNREKQLEANRRWYYNHRDARIRQTTAYAKAHPEQTRQYQAAYRQSSKYRTRYRRYYAEHKEQIAQYGRQWTSANPERHRARIRRYRARKVGLTVSTRQRTSQHNIAPRTGGVGGAVANWKNSTTLTTSPRSLAAEVMRLKTL